MPVSALLAALGAALLGAIQAQAAGLALVMAVDVSASVSADSYLLQRNGIARAFEDPRLADAISALPGGIEVLVMEWSDPESVAVTVDWQKIADGGGADAFAAKLRATRRSSKGLTAIGPALLAAAAQFDRLPEAAPQRVIDISGDGIANLGLPPRLARDRVVAAGISINALAILTQEPWLEGYYRRYVIGGPDAFVMAVRDPSTFAEAMLRKLVRELAEGRPSALKCRTITVIP